MPLSPLTAAALQSTQEEQDDQEVMPSYQAQPGPAVQFCSVAHRECRRASLSLEGCCLEYA
jgi:hypothetical protein